MFHRVIVSVRFLLLYSSPLPNTIATPLYPKPPDSPSRSLQWAEAYFVSQGEFLYELCLDCKVNSQVLSPLNPTPVIPIISCGSCHCKAESPKCVSRYPLKLPGFRVQGLVRV